VLAVTVSVYVGFVELSAQWQALGEDAGSKVADPMFVNPSFPYDDFSFMAGSPASSVGFVPFDTTQAGGLPGSPPAPPALAPAFPLQLLNQSTGF